MKEYVNCKSGNFCENFIFANNIKRHICDAENSRLGRDLQISVNDAMISAIREDFIFAKFHENKTLAKFRNSQYITIIISVKMKTFLLSDVEEWIYVLFRFYMVKQTMSI